MKPTVSIICITYNQGKYISQALESFLMQKTDFPFEILIHDDASTDNTADIIRKAVESNQNPHAIFKPLYETENQYSKGTYDFINTMLRQANGTYIAFCEGDDYWTDPNKLQKQVDYMRQHPSASLCFHRVQAIFEDSSKKAYTIPAEDETTGFTVEELIKRNFIQLNSVLYKARKYDNMPNSIMPQDWYLHLYHARSGDIGFIDEIMAVYRINAGGVWHDSQDDIDKIWRRFGVRWLGLYVEVLKLYSKNPEYRKLIEGSIITSFATLARIDKQHGDTLFVEALKTYPEYAELYIEDLREQALQLDEHSKEQSKIIDHYVALNKRLEKENRHLNTHPLVRLGRAAKKRVKHIVKPESKKG